MIQTEYIANFVGVDISNKLIVKDIAEIKDKDEFIDFIQSNFNHMSLKYLNPLQKLNQLKKLYGKEKNTDLEDKATDIAYELNEKVKTISVAVRNLKVKTDYQHLKKVGEPGKTYFSEIEMSRLRQIGNLKTVVSLADSNLLEDKLRCIFINKIYNKVLPNKMAIIQNNIKTLNLSVKSF